MKPYTHILFDLDGTITDPAEGITTCVRHALHCQGIEEENYQNLCRMIGPPLAEGFRFSMIWTMNTPGRQYGTSGNCLPGSVWRRISPIPA